MKHSVYTVAQLNTYIKNMFTQDFLLNSLYVKGEVSNCKYHSSGHIYFTLKDRKGTIACVMFAGNRNGLNFQLKEGQQVVVGGSVDVYERDGKYQLYAREITLDGEGALFEKFEKLKQKLSEMGMFAPEYKQPIPKYVKTLGIVTAPTGAAVRDIINVSKRRNPYIQIILYPAIVQGDAAVASIVNGIRALEQVGVDAMIVGRGGGSIEDLWAFNEEEVAKAIFDCQVPIVSAVGHETDTTIADFVADLRAPTPSAAAELLVTDVFELEEKMSQYAYTFLRQMRNKITQCKYVYKSLETRLEYLSPINQVKEKRMHMLDLEKRLEQAMNAKISESKNRLTLNAEIMKRLSPLNKLSSGFSYVQSESGECLKNIDDFHKGDKIYIHVSDGMATASVLETKRVDRE
ncbi:MAG: exodeoxyribonuclease VII large subunit [Lachnospiraceae bacterium]|nr:exodeoxyribonuclease VII large subunit [Lachnospiraceae bacterium]